MYRGFVTIRLIYTVMDGSNISIFSWISIRLCSVENTSLAAKHSFQLVAWNAITAVRVKLYSARTARPLSIDLLSMWEFRHTIARSPQCRLLHNTADFY